MPKHTHKILLKSYLTKISTLRVISRATTRETWPVAMTDTKDTTMIRENMLKSTPRASILKTTMKEILLKRIIRRTPMLKKAIMKASIL